MKHLPPESATMTALRVANPESVSDDGPDPAEGRWSQLEMLVATCADELRNLRYVYTAARPGKGKKPTPPSPIPRPGIDRGKRHKPAMSDAEAEFLWRHINGLPPDPNAQVRFTVIDGGG